jgi:beta-glucosidase
MSKNITRPIKPVERQVETLLKKMSLNEKVLLLSGRNVWHTNPIEHLGVRSVVMTDGPHGVRASHPEMGRVVGPTTCFPTGIAMGASWDPELLWMVGEALGEETSAMGCDVLLGPCVNIVRGPLGGRNFETYAEDPYLAGRLGVAYVKGVQSQGVGASVKHFACNNQEVERFRSSSNVDERTLREIYLPAFEAIVKEAKPWTVMSSYNRINGVYASQHHKLLKEILKGEWGFDGAVVSDWDANHTVFESIKNGLDLEMPGPAKYYGRLLEQAVANWQLSEAELDEAVRRVLRLVIRTGKLGKGGSRKHGSVNTPEHQTLARRLAEESAVLLKNERHILPLDITNIKSLAVIGPNAAEARIGGGGSSYAVPPYRVSPLQALRERLDGRVRIIYAKGCDNEVSIPIVPGDWLEMPNGGGIGLYGEYFNNSDMKGTPAFSGQDTRLDFWWFAAVAGAGNVQRSSGRWTGTLRVPETGIYQIRLTNSGVTRLYLDSDLVLDNSAPLASNPELGIVSKDLFQSLNAERAYAIRIEFSRHDNQDFAHWRLAMHLWQDPTTDDRLDLAVEAAKQCDVTVIFAGMPEFFESEGWDRPDMELPGKQNELIHRVVVANPNTVVVLYAGAPVNMPWRDQVLAILDAFYPGMEGGNAVARIILGEVNPSGKLPVTFPKRLEDTPAYINSTYPGARDINYGEGIFVGYRYYDKRKLEPAFPFGHGLSYSQFQIEALEVADEVSQGEAFEIRVKVTNTGQVAGKEVVQLYISDLEASLPRPVKELKGFQKVTLQPGEERVVSFPLVPRDLSFYDPNRKSWVAESGEFEVLVGTSSEDIRYKGRLTLN